ASVGSCVGNRERGRTLRRFGVLMITFAVLVTCPAVAGAGSSFPASIPVPVGSYPEGIAVGRGHDFYVGSLLDGAIYRGDLRTGQGAVLAPGDPGRAIAGLSFDSRSGLIWGVGSQDGFGRAFAFDGAGGGMVVSLSVPGAFLNDIVVTRGAAYVTDSLSDVLWSIPLDQRGRPAGPARSIPLSGDFTLVTDGPLPLNLNGIDATADGRELIAVHSTLGVLYRIDPATGNATRIDLGGDAVPNGDGIVLQGGTLYVVQNFFNQVAVVALDPAITSGRVTRLITSGLFRVPTTAARFGSSLYLVNARFDAGFPPFLGGERQFLDYDVVKVAR
ncbi:MAG: hypothetical protein ACRDMZ_19085, partial [Solirubrobacteraceae bacterium]